MEGYFQKKKDMSKYDEKDAILEEMVRYIHSKEETSQNIYVFGGVPRCVMHGRDTFKDIDIYVEEKHFFDDMTDELDFFAILYENDNERKCYPTFSRKYFIMRGEGEKEIDIESKMKERIMKVIEKNKTERCHEVDGFASCFLKRIESIDKDEDEIIECLKDEDYLNMIMFYPQNIKDILMCKNFIRFTKLIIDIRLLEISRPYIYINTKYKNTIKFLKHMFKGNSLELDIEYYNISKNFEIDGMEGQTWAWGKHYDYHFFEISDHHYFKEIFSELSIVEVDLIIKNDEKNVATKHNKNAKFDLIKQDPNVYGDFFENSFYVSSLTTFESFAGYHSEKAKSIAFLDVDEKEVMDKLVKHYNKLDFSLTENSYPIYIFKNYLHIIHNFDKEGSQLIYKMSERIKQRVKDGYKIIFIIPSIRSINRKRFYYHRNSRLMSIMDDMNLPFLCVGNDMI